MKISSLLKQGICEVNFGWHISMVGYPTLMSNISKLSEMPKPVHIKIRRRLKM